MPNRNPKERPEQTLADEKPFAAGERDLEADPNIPGFARDARHAPSEQESARNADPEDLERSPGTKPTVVSVIDASNDEEGGRRRLAEAEEEEKSRRE